MKVNMLKKGLIAGVVVTTALTISTFAYDVQGGTVTTQSAVNFRSEANTSADVLEKLYDGTRIAVLDESDDWYKVAADGVNGYIHRDYVEVQPVMNIEAGGAKVTAAVLNLRSEPNTSSDIVAKLSEGTVAKIIGINNGWFKVTIGSNTGYVHPDYISVVKQTASTVSSVSSGSSSTVVEVSNNYTGTTSNSTRQAIIDYASKFLGVRYVYGGTTPSGFDCSGFTQYVLAHFDISISRTSAAQYSSSVTKIKKSSLQPGDLVFFSSGRAGVVGHVGIYVGNGDFIHSSSPGDVVKYDSLNSSYYSSHYIGSGTVF